MYTCIYIPICIYRDTHVCIHTYVHAEFPTPIQAEARRTGRRVDAKAEGSRPSVAQQAMSQEPAQDFGSGM